MRFRFTSAANDEIDEILRFYLDNSTPAHDGFLAALREALERIEQFPNSGALQPRRHRRMHLRKYPYGVIYQVQGQTVDVIAVAHDSRRPGYWLER